MMLVLKLQANAVSLASVKVVTDVGLLAVKVLVEFVESFNRDVVLLSDSIAAIILRKDSVVPLAVFIDLVDEFQTRSLRARNGVFRRSIARWLLGLLLLLWLFFLWLLLLFLLLLFFSLLLFSKATLSTSVTNADAVLLILFNNTISGKTIVKVKKSTQVGTIGFSKLDTRFSDVGYIML